MMFFRDALTEGTPLTLVRRNLVRKDEIFCEVIVREDHDVSSFNLVAVSEHDIMPYYYISPVTGRVMGTENIYAVYPEDVELRGNLAARIFDWFLIKLAGAHDNLDPERGACV